MAIDLETGDKVEGQYIGFRNEKGQAHGPGKWTGNDGSMIKGTFKDNEPHGFV